MAEREQSFRHEMAKESAGLQAREHRLADESLKRDHKFRTRGQFFAFTITLVVFGAGVWLTFAGHPGVATTIMSLNLLGLVGAFLTDRFTAGRSDDSSENSTERAGG